MHRHVPDVHPARLGVFTAGEAYRAGWTASALDCAVARDRLLRLQRGVYVSAASWAADGADPNERARLQSARRAIAAALAIGPAAASHTSSALLAGLPVWQLPERACVTVPPRYTGDAQRVHLHRAGALAGHLLTGGPVPRLSTPRTVLDIAREHDIEDAVVVGDAALALRMLDIAQLQRCAARCAGWPGIRRARAMIDLLDERSESPLESVSRLRLARIGMPAPELQPDILDLRGVFLGRPDFYWDEFGVAGEVDGRMKYRGDPDDVWWREKQRQGPMEDVGLIFVRWTRSDLGSPRMLAARLERAFARGAARPRSDRAWVAQPWTGRFAPPIPADLAI